MIDRGNMLPPWFVAVCWTRSLQESLGHNMRSKKDFSTLRGIYWGISDHRINWRKPVGTGFLERSLSVENGWERVWLLGERPVGKLVRVKSRWDDYGLNLHSSTVHRAKWINAKIFKSKNNKIWYGRWRSMDVIIRFSRNLFFSGTSMNTQKNSYSKTHDWMDNIVKMQTLA